MIRSGLSLVEVMLAVLILGITVTTLVGLQGVLMRGVYTTHDFIERLPFIRSYLVIVERDRLYKQKKHEKIIDDPETVLTYTHKRPTSPALLQQTHLSVDQLDARWSSAYGTRRETCAHIRFRPEKDTA